MIKVLVHGIKEGKNNIDITTAVDKIENLYSEFFGDVHIFGSLSYNADRFHFILNAKAKARLICDISLDEYEEEFIANTSFILKDIGDRLIDIDNESEGNFRISNKEIDISKYIAEALALEIPMKKIAPKYRGIDINQIYPEHTVIGSQDNQNEKIIDKKSDKKDIDPRWSTLKDLKL